MLCLNLVEANLLFFQATAGGQEGEGRSWEVGLPDRVRRGSQQPRVRPSRPPQHPSRGRGDPQEGKSARPVRSCSILKQKHFLLKVESIGAQRIWSFLKNEANHFTSFHWDTFGRLFWASSPQFSPPTYTGMRYLSQIQTKPSVLLSLAQGDGNFKKTLPISCGCGRPVASDSIEPRFESHCLQSFPK